MRKVKKREDGRMRMKKMRSVGMLRSLEKGKKRENRMRNVECREQGEGDNERRKESVRAIQEEEIMEQHH